MVKVYIRYVFPARGCYGKYIQISGMYLNFKTDYFWLIIL